MSEDLALEKLRMSAAQACSLLKRLATPDRLLLLCQLSQGEYCVSDLEQMLNIQQPTLCQQLGVLREERLDATGGEGKQIFYSLASDEAMAGALSTVLWKSKREKIMTIDWDKLHALGFAG